MTLPALPSSNVWESFAPQERLRWGRTVIATEAAALEQLAERLDACFLDAVSLFLDCRGSVIVSGIGKAGLVGQKIAATLASTGTRSHFLHPVEAVHGDLGRVHRDDIVLMLSFSGETGEVTNLLPSLRELGVSMVAITGRPQSTLARAATVVLDLGPLEEACPNGLAPTTSTTAMLAVGDALALVVSRVRGFGREDFARFHPGGTLGRRLGRVEDEMRPLGECRVARESDSVRGVFVQRRKAGRRSGAVMLVDGDGHLTGIFTDSDLARLFESRRDAELDGPISAVMTRSPKTVVFGTRISEAIAVLAASKISELPVVDGEGKPLGMIDVTDVVGLLPPAALPQSSESEPGSTESVPATLRFPNRQGV